MNNSITPSQRQATVRKNVQDGAGLNWSYIFMNTLATVIACYGLFANSPAVVIGAMVVAMLLGPIAGVALALVDSDNLLLRRSSLSLGVGIVDVVVTAFVLGVIHKDIPLTHEIMARTAPNLMDLMIALAGGAAGAYATVSQLSTTLVGVAIATALVPPLSSASILLARGEFGLAGGAFLLAFTNIVAIQVASSAVLWLSGLHKVAQVSGQSIVGFLKRNAVSLMILGLLTLILSVNLQQVISRQLFETSVRGILRQEISSSPGSYLAEVRFETTTDTTIVRAVVRGPNPPASAQVAAMEARLPPPPDGTAIELRIRFVQTTTINRDGLLFTDVEFGEPE
jgi:uncharacterized hydrophobic protein (TIGR00271 family)